MRVNERVENLKKFFYGESDGREFFDVHHFINRVIAPQAKSDVRGDYHAVWQGVVTAEQGFSYNGATWQSSGITNRLLSAMAIGKRPFKTGPIHVDARYEEEGGSRKAIDFHVPVDFTQRRDGASRFAFSVISSSGKVPLLTIAKFIAERGQPNHTVITSHSLEGHRVAELLARRLRGIATQFKDEKGSRLLQPEITLVAGNNVDLPEGKRRPTRRELAEKGREALARLPVVERELEALKGEVATRKTTQASYAKLVGAAMRKGKALKEERDAARLETAQQRAGREAALAKLAEVGRLAEGAKFGTRGKTLERIKRAAK